MKFKTILLTALTLGIGVCSAQLNMNFVSSLPVHTTHSQNLNDVWGYVDETGKEYALVGGTKGTSVVDISVPNAPVELYYAPGLESIWRDIKTWGDYAYVTTEALNGLMIIDLSPLPASAALGTTIYTGDPGNPLLSAHNLYIDEFGFCYIFGSNIANGGVRILDLNSDPLNPVEVGFFENWYVHDGYAENNLLYLAHISDGFMSVVDVTDKNNPVLLGSANTPGTFTHNVWVSGNQYAFTTDEISGGYLGAYDVSDPANITELDRIQSSPGAGVIPHNVHVLQNHIITSHYSDGVVVHDVTYPYNMIEVGNYDTYPAQTMSYDGCWGAYPFFPSGLIAATDITEGLFILQPNYIQAAYLEGTVTDASTSGPLYNATITIAGSVQPENSGFNGFYATGMAAGGTFDVTYSKVGYYPQTISISISNGAITTQDVALTPIPPFALQVVVLEQGTNAPIENAQISLQATLITHLGLSNAIGLEDFSLFYQEEYQVTVGKWGYQTACEYYVIDAATGNLTIYLSPGYYDDFTFDFGWTVTGDATTGQFVRAEPFATSSGSNPGEDAEFDCGQQCYVTGNANQLGPDNDDVDGGFTRLRSPIIDMTAFVDPYVNYQRFFYNMHGPVAPDDSLKVFVSNGIQTVLIDAVGSEPGNFFLWIPKSVRILDYISLTPNMQFIFETSDYDPNVNITEAAIDHFYLVEESELDLAELGLEYLRVYPNPAQDRIRVNYSGESDVYSVVDAQGKVVLSGTFDSEYKEIDLSRIDSGIYVLSLDGKKCRFSKTN